MHAHFPFGGKSFQPHRRQLTPCILRGFKEDAAPTCSGPSLRPQLCLLTASLVAFIQSLPQEKQSLNLPSSTSFSVIAIMVPTSLLSFSLCLLAVFDAAATPLSQSHRIKKRSACRPKVQSFLQHSSSRADIGNIPVVDPGTSGSTVEDITSSGTQGSQPRPPPAVQPLPAAVQEVQPPPAVQSPPPSTQNNPAAGSSLGTTLGGIMQASFTYYGSGDTFGSGPCTTSSNACGSAAGGYTAAMSQNFFGAGPGQGAGPMCGTCWQLELNGKTMVVTIDNLCPIEGNTICGMGSQSATNSMGANIHFDLCLDSGANSLLAGAGTGAGTAVQVPCAS